MASFDTIKAVALDVDGVLTDGTFYWGADGAELKRFSFRDVMGVARARRAGILFALISGEDSPLVSRYAEKLDIGDVFRGCKDKASALREFADRRGLALPEIAFMGDDVNDLAAMAASGLGAAPSDAHEEVLRQARFRSKYPGGQGAVRELLDRIASGRAGYL